jgi:hypothetical protein
MRETNDIDYRHLNKKITCSRTKAIDNQGKQTKTMTMWQDIQWKSIPFWFQMLAKFTCTVLTLQLITWAFRFLMSPRFPFGKLYHYRFFKEFGNYQDILVCSPYRKNRIQSTFGCNLWDNGRIVRILKLESGLSKTNHLYMKIM